MTGNDIYIAAATLLGISAATSDANGDLSLRERTLSALNNIGSDLCEMPPIESLNDSLDMSEDFKEAAIYGVAMLLSLTDGDSEKNGVFASLYNSKRAAAKSRITSVSDALPKAVL